jgi:hypothetical protein
MEAVYFVHALIFLVPFHVAPVLLVMWMELAMNARISMNVILITVIVVLLCVPISQDPLNVVLVLMATRVLGTPVALI